jgi:HEAT repeat protein
MFRRKHAWFLVLILCVAVFQGAEARRRHHRHRFRGPAPTHPVVLWARTLSESTDPEQRKIAAFKLSQYSQPIFQEAVINELLRCMKDPDTQIKVLCTKALGSANPPSYVDSIRKALLDQYSSDEALRNTIVRTFIARRDSSPKVQDTFMESAMKAGNPDEQLVLLSYFQKFGSGSAKFVENLVAIYQKQDNIKVKRAIVKVLADRAEGQDAVIDLLSQCSENKDTPLALTCLGGLQVQARKDARAWSAVEKTMMSDDPDVLMASLDVINALPPSRNEAITNRLVSLITDMDDSEIQEKAVLALGICGTESESVVTTLLHLLEEPDTDESVRIAAALILGKEAAGFPDQTIPQLQKCGKEGASQSLRTACQLGLQELESHKVAVKPSPSPAASPASTSAPAKTAGGPAPASILPVEEKLKAQENAEAKDAVSAVTPGPVLEPAREEPKSKTATTDKSVPRKPDSDTADKSVTRKPDSDTADKSVTRKPDSEVSSGPVVEPARGAVSPSGETEKKDETAKDGKNSG